MEIVSMPDIRGARGGGGVRAQAAADPALPRHLRRQHAGGQPARRRQRQRAAEGRDRARHPLRDQEHELDALHHAGDRVRGAPADRHPRGRRHASSRRPGSTTRTGARPARCAPRRRRTTTATSPTPTSCRSSSSRPGSTRIAATLPELPDAKKARFVADYGMTEYDAGVLTAETASASYFEAVAAGPRRQAGGELGDQRALRPAEQGGPRHRREPGRRRRSSAA